MLYIQQTNAVAYCHGKAPIAFEFDNLSND